MGQGRANPTPSKQKTTCTGHELCCPLPMRIRVMSPSIKLQTEQTDKARHSAIVSLPIFRPHARDHPCYTPNTPLGNAPSWARFPRAVSRGPGRGVRWRRQSSGTPCQGLGTRLPLQRGRDPKRTSPGLFDGNERGVIRFARQDESSVLNYRKNGEEIKKMKLVVDCIKTRAAQTNAAKVFVDTKGTARCYCTCRVGYAGDKLGCEFAADLKHHVRRTEVVSPKDERATANFLPTSRPNNPASKQCACKQ